MSRSLSLYAFVFTIFLLIELVSCKTIQYDRSKNKPEVILATWNIGYFSNGVSSRSFIKASEYDKKLKDYRTLIYDSIHPDIISINEYNRVFIGKDNEENENVTSFVLFDQYKDNVVGPRKGFRKALFSKLKLKNIRLIYFNCHKSFEGDEDIKNTTSYYIESTFSINGKKVKLVHVHLMFSRKIPRVVQQLQIEELIKSYYRNKRVVIFGDFNTADYSQFKKAGYTLANNGKMVTFPKKETPLDNIAVKGLTISEVRVIKTDLSDHYPIMCKISTK